MWLSPLPPRSQLPDLEAIHGKFVPTWKHLPVELRHLWAKALSRATASVVVHNSTEAWQELLMLPKCTLCSPPRSGKAHRNKRLAFTRSRLLRWLSGERSSLWTDLPHYSPPRDKRLTEEGAKHRKHARCIDLCGEGAFSKSCSTLIKPAPLGRTLDVATALTMSAWQTITSCSSLEIVPDPRSTCAQVPRMKMQMGIGGLAKE